VTGSGEEDVCDGEPSRKRVDHPRRSRVPDVCKTWTGGFLSVEDENRINACFQRAKRYGFTDTVYNIAGLREHSYRTLFKSLQIEGHCLASILPPVRSNIGELSNRGHIFTLPKCSTVAYKNSYLPRCLYNFI
jgi:hypothetical protein